MSQLPSFHNPTLDLPEADIEIVNERIVSAYGFSIEQLTSEVQSNDYGLKWPAGVPQYHKELHGYFSGGLDGHSAFFHMVNAIRLDLPLFQFTADGYINTEALRVIYNCVVHKDLGIAGAASSGKTFPIAAFVLQDWKCAPNKTLSFVCTTSMGASEDRIWGAIVKLFQSSLFKVGTYIPHKSMIVFGKFSESAQDREYNAAIKALAIPVGKEGQNAIDTTRGRKQTRVRLVFDELPEMELYVTRAAVNLESAPELRVFGIGNPSSHLDAHGQMCQPDHPLGFKSISKDSPCWKTRTGWCIFLNGEWSFNFQATVNEKIPFPHITNHLTLAKMLNRCHNDKNSLEYFRNAIGFWAGDGISITVLTIDLLQEHKCTEDVKWRSTSRKKICGFDTGFSHGGDLCVAQFGELGEDMTGRQQLKHLKEKVYHIPATGIFEDEVAKLVVPDCIALGISPDGFGMDISSDGGKVMRAIIREWLKLNLLGAEVIPISSMERPSTRLVSNIDPRKCIDVYDRKVTEYWMVVREAVLCETIKGINLFQGSEVSPLILELCTRTYEVKGKKISLETKYDMKSRTLGRSPDRADAFCYMVEMARRHGFNIKTAIEAVTDKRESSVLQFGRSYLQQPNNSYQDDSWGEDDE